MRQHTIITLLALATALSSLIAGEPRTTDNIKDDGAAAQHSDRPNIIVIFTDDQTYRAIGYNDPAVKTPHLDALAASGVTFDRAYVASPICAASRASMMTGLFPQQHGVTALSQGAFRPYRNGSPKGRQLLPERLAEAGYLTAFYGKSHLGNPKTYGFDAGDELRGHDDVKTFEQASAFIKSQKGLNQPFFLWLAPRQPHVPLLPEQKWLDLYPSGSIRLPKNFRAEPSDASLNNQGTPDQTFYRDSDYRRNIGQLSSGPPRDEKTMLAFMQAYYAVVSHLDNQIGEFTNLLRETGLMENTVVIFLSDNGYHLGSHGLGNKITMHEESVRVPMFAFGAGIGPGKTTRALVSALDVYPTVLELAGATEPPVSVMGKSLLPLLKDSHAAHRHAVFSECVGIGGKPGEGHRMARGDRWKLILSDRDEEFLFDQQNDPFELNNRVADPELAPVLRRLRSELIPFMKKIGDRPYPSPNEPDNPGENMQTFESYLGTGYNQKYRPQFHFTSRKNWLNDPNGMMYYDGEYHLFFQHNPKGNQWGNMTWGHAVSKDMVHWEQLPHAIRPYGGGTIFSGTAAVDHNNTLGKQKGEIKTLIASYTLALKGPFYQALAYSTDKGRTFELFNEGKAVVPNQGIDRGERDPKIFWYEPTQKWVMILWVKKAITDKDRRGKNKQRYKNLPNGAGKVRFFTSDNLTNWEVASDFDRDWVFECMDFVHLPVDGDPNNKKWLLFDASFDYEMGEFDGTTFTTDKKVGRGDFGPNCYAAQTFNNSPDGRTVVVGWMRKSEFLKVGMPFNQQMSFPTTMELRTTPDGIKLFRWPIKEIASLYTEKHDFGNRPIAELADALRGIDTDLIDASIEFDPTKTGNLEWDLRGLKVAYIAENQQFTYEGRRLAAPPVNGKAKLRVLVDRGSIELFANDGAAVATHFALPDPENQSISLSGSGSVSLVINELKSSWPQE